MADTWRVGEAAGGVEDARGGTGRPPWPPWPWARGSADPLRLPSDTGGGGGDRATLSSMKYNKVAINPLFSMLFTVLECHLRRSCLGKGFD